MTRQSELVNLKWHVSQVTSIWVKYIKGKEKGNQIQRRNQFLIGMTGTIPPGVPCLRRNRLHKQEDVCPAMGKYLLQMSQSW